MSSLPKATPVIGRLLPNNVKFDGPRSVRFCSEFEEKSQASVFSRMVCHTSFLIIVVSVERFVRSMLDSTFRSMDVRIMKFDCVRLRSA